LTNTFYRNSVCAVFRYYLELYLSNSQHFPQTNPKENKYFALFTSYRLGHFDIDIEVGTPP